MRYDLLDIENLETEVRRVAVRSKGDIINELGSVEITSTGIPSPTNPITWNALPSFSRYRVVIERPSTSATLVNRTVEGTSFTPDFTALAGDTVQVFTSRRISAPVATPEITSISISAGDTIEEGASKVFTIGTEGIGNYDTSYTASGAGFSFSISGNQLTVTETGGAVNDTKSFAVTSNEDNAVTASRTLTVVSASTYTPVDSLQGDFDALQALYNATQGAGVPTLSSTAELPAVNDAEYPFMYMINGEIHALERDDRGDFTTWENKGAPWPNKTGWDDMTPETMGDALGVTTDANGRVIEVDLWRINPANNGASNPGYTGNVLAGILPPEINNLHRLNFFAIKQNFFHGELPDMSNLIGCTDIILAGQDQYLLHDENNRGQWHEFNHRSAIAAGQGKKVITTNRFRSALPASIDGFQNLTLFEFRFQFTLGPLPAWTNLSSIRALFIDEAQDAGSGSLAGSEIPTSWGNLTTVVFFEIRNNGLAGEFPQTINDNWENLAKININGNNFYGRLPQFIKSRDKRYVLVGSNNFGKDSEGNLLPPEDRQFPTGYFNGDNANMTKWQIPNCNVTGAMPEIPVDGTPNDPSDPNNDRYELRRPSYPSTKSNYTIDAPGIGFNDLSGSVAEWYQKMGGIQTFFIGSNNFTEFPDLIPEQNNLKTFYIQDNSISSPLPDKSWGQRHIPWFQTNNNNIPGPIPDKWISLFVQDTDSMGWSSDETFSGAGTTLTWASVANAIAYEVEIRNSSESLVRRERWMTTESLTVSGLESDTYTWRVRGLVWRSGWSRFMVQNNDITGYLHDWYGHVGGFAYGCNFSNNRFTYSGVADNYAFLKQELGSNFSITDQKPFPTEIDDITTTIGSNETIDLSAFDTAGNVYQWRLNGTDIAGETSSSITITDVQPSDLGDYTLRITNSNYPDISESISQPINLNT